MDILRRKRHSAASLHATAALALTPVAAPASSPEASSLPAPASAPASTPASTSGCPLSTSGTSGGPPSTASPAAAGLSASSRTSSIDSTKSGGFFQAYLPRAMRSLSRGSASSMASLASAASTAPGTGAAPAAQSPDSPSSSPPLAAMAHFPRRVLRKSHRRRSSGHELHLRRGSTGSDLLFGGAGAVRGHASMPSNASDASHASHASSAVLDWRLQPIELHAALDWPDALSSKTRLAYVAATADCLVLFRSKADALAALPQLADVPPLVPPPGSTLAGGGGGTRVSSSMLPPAEPAYVIPLHAVLAVFRTERAGLAALEISWRLPYPAIATDRAVLYLRDARDRDTLLARLAAAVDATSAHDHPDAAARVFPEVEECIRKVVAAEEPAFAAAAAAGASGTVPAIFPVVYRDDRHDHRPEKARKSSQAAADAGASHFLVVGVHLCFLLQISRASAVQSAALDLRYQACGLVTLEAFSADWTARDHRFAMRFRDPFKQPLGLDLASRHTRRIVRALTRADKFLKPAWPTLWQTQELFHVAGLPPHQHVVAGEDFGGFQRTLAAFYAAYRCPPVDWEINWRAPYAPEFRLLPAGPRPYSDLQLLAVLRALRYNDYFRALSFCDVDLSALHDRYDSARRGSVAYMSRSGVCLTAHETSLVQKASLLHQEFHALAFASGTLRQIDLTNCLPAAAARRPAASVQFLVPILNLLAAGLTRCNRLFLRGCPLGDADVECLAAYIAPAGDLPDGAIAPALEAVALEALDLAYCGLSDQAMNTLFHALAHALPAAAGALHVLDAAHNCGRVPAALVQQLMASAASLRTLHLAGCLTGPCDGALLPVDALDRLVYLEELDLSNYTLNESTVAALAAFLETLSARQASMQNGGYGYALRRLVLTNCGLTGRHAARLFRAMAGLYDVHLHLSSNPLEEDVADLADALAHSWGGRFGLHLDMVEFQDEAHYGALVRALAASPHIDYLSLVGTAPVPVADDTCSDATVDALAAFFAENRSVRYLDLSGYSGKLDDGQLGKGFGGALRGLAHNTTLTHLRVRNQRLHDSIGTLGTAVAANTALRYLDCGDNGFTATDLRFVAKSLEANTALLVYALPLDELEQTLRQCMKEAPAGAAASPATSPVSTTTPTRKQAAAAAAAFEAGLARQTALLRGEIEAAAADIHAHTQRNADCLQAASGCVLDLDEAADTGGERGWPSLQLRAGVPAGPGVHFTTTPLEEELSAAAEAAVVDADAHESSAVMPDTVLPSAAGDLDVPLIEKALFAEPDLARMLEKLTMEDGTEYIVCKT